MKDCNQSLIHDAFLVYSTHKLPFFNNSMYFTHNADAVYFNSSLKVFFLPLWSGSSNIARSSTATSVFIDFLRLRLIYPDFASEKSQRINYVQENCGTKNSPIRPKWIFIVILALLFTRKDDNFKCRVNCEVKFQHMPRLE